MRVVRVFVRSVSRVCAFFTRTNARSNAQTFERDYRACGLTCTRAHARAQAREQDQIALTISGVPTEYLSELVARHLVEERIDTRVHPSTDRFQLAELCLDNGGVIGIVRCRECGAIQACPPFAKYEQVLDFIAEHACADPA